MVICFKKQKQCCAQEREVGDCPIGLSLADSRGLILTARVGKHTNELIEQLVMSTAGKTDCKQFNSDDWGGYERVLRLRFSTTLAKIEHSDWSAPTALFDNTRDGGIDDRTSVAKCGNRRR